MKTTETSNNKKQGAGKPTAQAQEKKPRRKRVLILSLLLVLFLAAGTFAVWNLIPRDTLEQTVAVALLPELDANALEITDKESLIAAMQEEADAAYFTLQVHPEASFSAATGEGSFYLMNPTTNVYPITFTITLDATGEVLYQSGALMPGQQIQSLTLSAIPEPGSHKATVSVTIFNPDTQEKEGETQAIIDLTVV